MENVNYGPLIGFFAALLGLGAFLIIFLLTIILIFIISFWKIFTKAGRPGWQALIPIYNMIVLAEIAKQPWWYGLIVSLAYWFIFIPGIGWIALIAEFVFLILIWYKLALAFGKDASFAVGLILLPVIFLPTLAFSKDIQYIQEQPNQPQIPSNNPY